MDTSAISAYYHPGHPTHAPVKAFIDSIPATDLVFVSAVAIGEISFGASMWQMDKGYPSTVATSVLAGAHSYTILDVTKHTGVEYGKIKARVALKYLPNSMDKKHRRPWIEDWIDQNSGGTLKVNEGDLWMCAQAKERNLTLLTTDKKIKRITDADPTIQVKEII